ncbi:hypothetical protein BHE74_00001691 [Ensete ventricosum]|uniref:Uncharacterized protein n=1 Tax=Ensete ventricosum TaxID=4639 RepID=A0A444DHS9_ENSVE|nr:hypothetical protein B296_00006142 [Ensete ventricosum]RWV97681.1 hypothetical protein GW17_00039519 [Ensete ventricosum]RWW89368.1 hypothetical protein BHE74_00001691 [Ensete ventricosum]RZR70526.1 hypothetical protein BHM03_00000378 [Ensete ventricosum]
MCCFLGFDVGDLSENGPEDIEGMDASAAHIANLLSAEPADSMLGHYTIPGEMDDVCKFLITTLGLDGSYS